MAMLQQYQQRKKQMPSGPIDNRQGLENKAFGTPVNISRLGTPNQDGTDNRMKGGSFEDYTTRRAWAGSNAQVKPPAPIDNTVPAPSFVPAPDFTPRMEASPSQVVAQNAKNRAALWGDMAPLQSAVDNFGLNLDLISRGYKPEMGDAPDPKAVRAAQQREAARQLGGMPLNNAAAVFQGRRDARGILQRASAPKSPAETVPIGQFSPLAGDAAFFQGMNARSAAAGEKRDAEVRAFNERQRANNQVGANVIDSDGDGIPDQSVDSKYGKFGVRNLDALNAANGRYTNYMQAFRNAKRRGSGGRQMSFDEFLAWEQKEKQKEEPWVPGAQIQQSGMDQAKQGILQQRQADRQQSVANRQASQFAFEQRMAERQNMAMRQGLLQAAMMGVPGAANVIQETIRQGGTTERELFTQAALNERARLAADTQVQGYQNQRDIAGIQAESNLGVAKVGADAQRDVARERANSDWWTNIISGGTDIARAGIESAGRLAAAQPNELDRQKFELDKQRLEFDLEGRKQERELERQKLGFQYQDQADALAARAQDLFESRVAEKLQEYPGAKTAPIQKKAEQEARKEIADAMQQLKRNANMYGVTFVEPEINFKSGAIVPEGYSSRRDATYDESMQVLRDLSRTSGVPMEEIEREDYEVALAEKGLRMSPNQEAEWKRKGTLSSFDDAMNALQLIPGGSILQAYLIKQAADSMKNKSQSANP